MSNQTANIIKPALLTSILLLCAASSSRGQVVYKTGFDAPVFVNGSPLAGQDGWVAPDLFSPNAAIITTDQPRIGQQTVHVLGEDLVHQDLLNSLTGGFYDAIGSYRHAVDYDTGGTHSVRVSALVRIDGPGTAAGNHFFSASIAAIATLTDGSTAEVGELAICSDGRVYGYTGNDFVPTFLKSAPITLGQWHHLTVVADFAAHTSTFYVDDQSLGTIPFDPNPGDPGVGYTTIFRRGSMLTYAAPDTATLRKANYAAHYDNFMIQAAGSSLTDN